METRQAIQIFNRLGFGATGALITKVKEVDFQVYLESEHLELEDLTFGELEDLTVEAFKNGGKKYRDFAKSGMQEINVAWVKKMIHSQNPIHEKINLFWHHHFACEIKNPLFARAFSNMIRTHSLGNFRDLIKGVSKSAAMIAYLNLRQNKKAKPNEDFARELCELFTLGENILYTEQDVKEIGRAFTGSAHNMKGKFVLRKRQHDFEEKTIFGETGNYNGDDVIDLILKKKECARFIATNVYAYFVNANIHEDHVEELTDVIYKEDYDLKKMFVHLASAEWFIADENVMNRIKSPIELLVGFGRMYNLDSSKNKAWLFYQRALNQILYRPPNVGGWPVDKEWINSNSLSIRLRFPEIILTNKSMNVELKPELDEVDIPKRKNKNRKNPFSSYKIDWDYFHSQFEGYSIEELLFSNKLSDSAKMAISAQKNPKSKSAITNLFCLPEYQLI